MRRCGMARFMVAIAAGLAVVLAACDSGAPQSTSAGGSGSNPGKPQRGGDMTVLLSGLASTWERGLDPATAGSAPTVLLSAIYGQLFQLGKGGKILPGLATGYELSDQGKTLTISLRKGVTFQDGTPFNAEAVAWNIKRDLEATCVCNPAGSWPPFTSEGITTPDDHTVVLHFARPYAPVVHSIMGSSVNRIASPAAVRRKGEGKFKFDPVGAGPFKVVQDAVDSKLVLKRHDGYWQKGRPYLDKLTFKTIGNDQAAYQVLLAGQADVTFMTSPSIIQIARQNENLTATLHQGSGALAVQLNTATPPFDKKLAREAIYYATNPKAIATHMFHGMYPVTQSFTGPGSLFAMPKVPGYRTYDRAKAKQIVERLGGLQVDLMTGDGTIYEQLLTVLKAQWAKAGIQTTIHTYTLPRLIQEFDHQWQAALQATGGWDPGIDSALPFRYASDAEYTGVHDPKLDRLMRRAATVVKKDKRARLYARIAKYISDQAYSPFLFPTPPATVTTKGVYGPGISSKLPILTALVTEPHWKDVWIAEEAR